MKLLVVVCVLFGVVAQLSAAIFFFDDTLEGRLFCDFRRQKCNWYGWDKWEWLQPVKSMQFDGPPLLGSNYDHALMANFTKIRMDLSNSGARELSSPIITPKGPVSCLRFLYSMHVPNGYEHGLTLTLQRDYNRSAELLFSRGNVEEDRWFEEEIEIRENKYFRLNFKAYARRGYIAIQAIQLEDRACHQKRRMCDFEAGAGNGLCGWTAESHNRPWGRVKASKTSQKIKSDVTSKSLFGNVAAVENLNTREASKLVSPVLTKELVNDDMCFSFWSQRTHGAYVHLRLLRREMSGKETELWKSDPDFEPPHEWKRSQIKMNFTENIRLGDRLVFEAMSEVENGGIALDDVTFQFVCESRIACRFSEGFCNWIHDDTVSDSNWSFGEQNRVVDASKLNSDVAGTMKVYDKVKSVGAIYTDFTGAPKGVRQRMELMSNFVDKRAGCAGIQYTVDDMGEDLSNSFRLDQLFIDGQRKTVWQFNPKETGLKFTWRPTQIKVPAADQPYRLVLSATSSDPSTRIGVEDISFTQATNACQPFIFPPTEKPQSHLEKTLRRLISDLLRGLRSDTNRISALAKVVREDPMNPAINKILKAIEDAIELAK